MIDAVDGASILNCASERTKSIVLHMPLGADFYFELSVVIRADYHWLIPLHFNDETHGIRRKHSG